MTQQNANNNNRRNADLVLPFVKLRSGTTYYHIEEERTFTKVCDAFSVADDGTTAIHGVYDNCKVLRNESPVHRNYHYFKQWYLNLGRNKIVETSSVEESTEPT